MKKIVPKLLAAMALGLAFTLAAGILCWYLSPISISYAPLWEEETLSLDEGTCYNCTVDAAGNWIPDGDDPMVYFYFTNDTETWYDPMSVLLRLSKPLNKDTFVQVYYAGPETELSEEHSVRQVMRAGSRAIALDLPGVVCSLIRLDIDAEVQIERISIGFDRAELIRDPYPLDWGKTLLCAAIAAGIIFSFLTLPALRACFLRLYRGLTDPAARPVAVDIIYAVCAGLLLLHHVVVTLYYPAWSHGSPLMMIAAWPFAILSILMGRMWKKTGFWLLVAFWLLKYLRVFWTEPHNLAYADDNLSLAVYAFFICYSVGSALRPGVRTVFLRVFCAAWTLFVCAFCVIGLTALWNNTPIENLGGGFYSLDYNRLNPIYHNIVGGVFIAVSAGVAILGMAQSKQRWIRILYGLVLAIEFVTCGVTCARTSFGGIAVILGGGLCILADHLLEKKRPDAQGRRGWIRTVALCIAFVILFAGISVAQIYVSDAVNALRTRGVGFISRALAEEENGPIVLAHHGINFNQTLDQILSGRIELWREVLHDVFTHPDVMLWGRSIYNPMAFLISNWVDANVSIYGHTHNLFLQNLLDSGIPGLVLLCSIVIHFLWHALRLIRNRHLPLWQRLVPLPAIAALICEIADCTTYINYAYPQMTLLYLFMGLTIALSLDAQKQRGQAT